MESDLGQKKNSAILSHGPKNDKLAYIRKEKGFEKNVKITSTPENEGNITDPITCKKKKELVSLNKQPVNFSDSIEKEIKSKETITTLKVNEKETRKNSSTSSRDIESEDNFNANINSQNHSKNSSDKSEKKNRQRAK